MKKGFFGLRTDKGGLASQGLEFCRHMKPDKVVALDLGPLGRGPADPSLVPPNTTWVTGTYLDIPTQVIEDFLRGLDVVFTCETEYHPELFAMARERGVRTFLQANPELNKSFGHDPDVICPPTHWELERFDNPRVLAVPVARDRLPFRLRTEAKTFVHMAAPAMLDRNGTTMVLDALRYVRTPIKLIIIGMSTGVRKRNWRHEVEARTIQTRNYWEVWPEEGDVLLYPRRYGGNALPLQEAASLGMPIISTDLEPQRSWLSPDCLVPAVNPRPARMIGGQFKVYSAESRRIAAKIDQLAQSPELVEKLSRLSDEWAESISWQKLEGVYRTALETW